MPSPSERCPRPSGCVRPEFCDTFGYACMDLDRPELTPALLQEIERQISGLPESEAGGRSVFPPKQGS
jgi:hypothetical protein